MNFPDSARKMRQFGAWATTVYDNAWMFRLLTFWTRTFRPRTFWTWTFILVRGNDISYRPLGFFPLHCWIKPILAKSCRRRKQVYSAWISQILREKCNSLVRERLLFTTMPGRFAPSQFGPGSSPPDILDLDVSRPGHFAPGLFWDVSHPEVSDQVVRTLTF